MANLSLQACSEHEVTIDAMLMIGRVVVMGLVAVKFQSRLRKDARIKAVSR